MNPNTIRTQFLDFFRERGHTIVPSAPVVPHGDPTLLFTNAGMNQFKEVFLEQGSRPYTRAVNSQKCIRVSGKHNDLEEVGPSPSHHTFFEMLGNWSFGDYYKHEAISWAWELLTKVWSLDPARLYATVFAGDEQVGFDKEAYDVWHGTVGLPAERISRHGKKDNFWEMGEVGPCGPCSELHYDFGPSFCRKSGEKGHVCAVNGDCGRIVELWNLVFIQYRRDETGKLHSLPRRHVDTGAGFERILKAVEGVGSNYETSVFFPLIEAIEKVSGVPYAKDARGNPHRVAADHIRMLAFSLADGVLPSNDGRGYVVRRVLRRAARYGREIGLEKPFLYKLVDPLIAVMGEAYPEVKSRYKHITGVIRAEEESFARTLGRGLELFGGILEQMTTSKSRVVSGEDAFKLYDTYGFPLDLTELIARERGLTVDTTRFSQLMEAQKEMARGEAKFTAGTAEIEIGLKTQFVGYTHWFRKVPAKVIALVRFADFCEIVLDKTPFYPESGGQVADKGWIILGDIKHDVVDVAQRGDAIVHRISGIGKGLRKGRRVIAQVDTAYRRPTQYNHTATHLLHKALRKIVGKHCNQAGSLVAPDRMRFDFTHFEKLTPEQLIAIELEVNTAIRANYEVRWTEMPYKQAIEAGVTALFGEKYGDIVRVVRIGGVRSDTIYSQELCGGCHVSQTGKIGLFRIVSEEAASAGVRRIEVVTGEAALRWTQEEHRQMEAVQDLVGSRGSDPVEKLAKTLAEKKALEKEVERLSGVEARQTADDLLAQAVKIDDIRVVTRRFPAMDVERLKLIGDAIRSKNARAVALLVSPTEAGAGQLVCVVGDALIVEGKLKAGDLVGKAARLAGGGGGGKPHMATAGAKSADGLDKAVSGFEESVRKLVE